MKISNLFLVTALATSSMSIAFAQASFAQDDILTNDVVEEIVDDCTDMYWPSDPAKYQGCILQKEADLLDDNNVELPRPSGSSAPEMFSPESSPSPEMMEEEMTPDMNNTVPPMN
ncbi:MAG: hypothetical protein WA865_20225 [Spirulinaceae cyanobacterium]